MADRWEDVKSTVKPYRTKTAILNDFLQPIYGLGNLLKGCVYLALIVPLFLFLVIKSIAGENFKEDFKYSCITSFSWFIDGILSILRGATQIAATPLSWFVKAPLRGVIRFFTDKKDLLIENRASVQRYVDFENNHYPLEHALSQIHKKYENALYSNISPETEHAAYNNFQQNQSDKETQSQYLKLFSPPTTITSSSTDSEFLIKKLSNQNKT